jgi:chemotaxis protein CheZ
MHSVIMGDLHGNHKRIAFDIGNVRKIINKLHTNVVFSTNGEGAFVEEDGQIFPVGEPLNRGDIKDYFIFLKSGVAYNLKDFQLLFSVKELPDQFLSGVAASGEQYVCRRWNLDSKSVGGFEEPSTTANDEKLKNANTKPAGLMDLKDMIKKLKNGQFFEALTMEFSGKIKEVAQELIDFRRDIQNKIEPDIVEIAAKDIPEASNQLEGVNQTLEQSTMKIMDINEEQLSIAEGQVNKLELFISENGGTEKIPGRYIEALQGQIDCMKRLVTLSMSMTEPLSFQDLVGQRIQKIIRLVNSMETRIKDMIISFGIKFQKHKEDPSRSFEELRKDVEQYKSELKGPQNKGEGLKQSEIDDLLATL